MKIRLSYQTLMEKTWLEMAVSFFMKIMDDLDKKLEEGRKIIDRFIPTENRQFWNDLSKNASPEDEVNTSGLIGFEAYQKEWGRRWKEKEEKAKIKLAQLEEEFPLKDRILAIAKMNVEKRLQKELQELDEYELNLKNSNPPAKSLGSPVAETNFEPVLPKVQTWETFINESLEGQNWVIDGLLRPGWLAVLGGHGKQGKSTLAVHLLNALSQGQQFINNTLAVPAIYINCEMSQWDMQELIKTVSADSPLRENAKIINEVRVPLNLEWLESFLVQEELPGICVIDSFRGAFMLSGDSENQAGTVGNILRKLEAIARRTNWAIIVIHHFRKSGKGEALDLAGSGEWLSAPDVVYTWSCPKPNEPGTLIITGRVPPSEPLSIKFSREKIEFLGTVTQQTIESERQRVLEVLTDNPQTSADIAEIVELPESTVRKRLEELLQNNNARRVGEGKKGNPYLWQLNEGEE